MLTISLLRKTKQLSSEQGFTMLEVLAAILITTAFTAAAMQLMVANVIFKVNAQKQAQASFWVQENKEQIIAKADSLPTDSSKCTSATNSYTVDLWKLLEPSSSSTFPANIDTTLVLNDTGPNDGNFEKTILNKSYQLKRTYKIKTDDPDILVINYKVIDPEDTDDPIIETNFEVKPNAYYECD